MLRRTDRQRASHLKSQVFINCNNKRFKLFIGNKRLDFEM